MNLRFAAAEDAEILEAVHAKAFDAAWTATDIVRLMQILGGFALIAEDDADAGGGVVGFILARTMALDAEILTLAVAPWARRKGVAVALVEAVVAEAQRRGAESLFLEVAADNVAAHGLYERVGFARVGLRKSYYGRSGGPSADALVLRRVLNRPSP
jgi:ribosomal-protein-alanine N-acetyltransferase